MQEKQQYIITNATYQQLLNYEQIQYNLGWDPFKKSYLTLWQINPNGLFFGKINQKIISCIAALKYSNHYGFIAVFWVKKAYRGKGYGYKLFLKAMQFLSDCEVIALDSNQNQDYKKWGFKYHCNSLKRYVQITPEVDSNLSSLIISDIKMINIKEVAQFDKKYFPAERYNFINKSFQIGKPFVSYDKLQKKILGYTIVTKCPSGFAISPLIASDIQIAQDLIKSVFQFYKQGKNGKNQDKCLIVFTLDEEEHITKLIKKWFPSIMYSCQRMYYHGKNFVKDFNRSGVYAFSGYQRG